MKARLYTLYGKMNRVSLGVTKVLEALCAVFTFTCFLTLIFQVFYRLILVKFFAFSFPFTEEFARYLLIWTVYLLAGVNLREGSMVAVNFIYDRLEEKNRLYLYCLTRVMAFAFLAIVFLAALKIVEQNVGFRSSTLRAPGWLLYSAPAVGILLLGYETVTEFLGVLAGEVAPFGSRMESQTP